MTCLHCPTEIEPEAVVCEACVSRDDSQRRLPVLRFESAGICKPCGGRCCKNIPGSALPEDFGAPSVDVMRSRIKAAIRSGRWAIDWWEGDPSGRDEVDQSSYLRPAVSGYEGRTRHGSWGGRCTFLSATGCELEHDDRPSECRALEPREDGDCKSHIGGKQQTAIAWLPYQALLNEF